MLSRFVVALGRTNVKSALALRGAFVAQALFMAINNFVFFVFWWVLLRRVPEIRGWRLADVEVLFGLTAMAFGLTVALLGGVRHLARLIDDAELDTLLTQPKPTLLYALGMRSHPSGFGDLASGLVFLLVSGHLTWSNAALVLVAVVAAAAVLLGTGIVFFSLPFWFSRTETLARQLWEITITFALYPEPLFGGALRLLLFTLLPAGFIAYLPADVVRHPSVAHMAVLITAAAAYVRLGAFVFSRGLKRYASGSRFVVFG